MLESVKLPFSHFNYPDNYVKNPELVFMLRDRLALSLIANTLFCIGEKLDSDLEH